MRSAHTIAILVLAAAMSGATAQGIYKTIGPDGKPVFSDKPPSNPGAHVEVIKAPPLEPVAPPADTLAPAPNAMGADDAMTSTEPAGMAAKRAHRAKHAKRALPAEAETASAAGGASASNDAAQEKAVLGVLGLEDLMNQTVELCMKTLPTSFGKYADTADAWRARNGDVLARAHALLEKNLPKPRALEAALKERNHNSLAPVADSNMGARIKWCDQSMLSLDHGDMDPKNRPALVRPLLGGG